MCLYYKMPNTTSKSNTSKKRKRERERSISPRTFASPSPALSTISNISSISQLSQELIDNPENKPIDTSYQTMQEEISGFKPYKVQKIFRKFKNNESNTGGKKNKRITIKKKKSRKTLKKPMFKRNKV